MKTYILGHQKPDTDSVVAPLALEFLFSHAPIFGYQSQNPEAVICDPINPETEYLFSTHRLIPPHLLSSSDITPADQFILVDHNEADQRLPGLDPNQIIEVIDHHKINLNLPSPITITFKPWGSSSTICYHLFRQAKLKPEPILATLLLSGILSDTVGFKSVTTTPIDQEYGQELARLARITDLNEFTFQIFAAKSNVSKLSEEQIATNDFKIFDFGPKVFISQIETVEQPTVLKRQKELLNAMKLIKSKHQVDLVFVAITDILAVNTKLLCCSEKEIELAQTAFGVTARDHVVDIGPKLSRKKEIAPVIEAAISKA